MFTNAADSHVNGTVMRLQFATGHFFQQFCARLDFARILTEVKHGAEFAAWQFILLAIRTNQRAAVDVQLPAIELVALDATAFFADGTRGSWYATAGYEHG